MLRTYRPKYFNALIVLGSGIESAPGDITAQQLVKELDKLSSPSRKVNIIMVIFGQPPNYRQLQLPASGPKRDNKRPRPSRWRLMTI